MSIKPILHRILLKPDAVEETTPSGIVIPKELLHKERKAIDTATVESIGETVFADSGGGETTINIGDKVVIARYSGKEIKDIDDTIYLVVNDEDILVILKEEV